MKAMLWKELRENFKWALLALIGLGLAETYGLYYFDPTNPNDRGITLLNPTFLMATSFGNAIVGLLLGFVQILPEQRRDQWAALLHRPVPRSVIYRGKALAGLLLYFFAATPPFLFCVWLSATPGHFVAPFLPVMVLPGLSDIFIGVAYYFAALTVGLQRGSWFGPRVYALMAAVYVSCTVTDMHYFYVVTEAAVLMAIVLAVAAWGAMQSNGKFGDRPWLTRAALLAAVFYGVCGIGVLGSLMLAATTEQRFYYANEYRLTQEGQPILVTTGKDLTTKITDLAGNPVTDERYTGSRYYENTIDQREVTFMHRGGHLPNYDDYFNYRSTYEYIQEISLYGATRPIQWFYLSGPQYVVGIDRRTKAPAQVVDHTGFHPAETPITPFSEMTASRWYESPAFYAEGPTAFKCDFEKEKITPFPSSDNGPVYGIETFSYQPNGGKGTDSLYVVAREKNLELFDSAVAPLAVLPLDPKLDLDRWGMIEFGVNHSGTKYYITCMPSLWLPWEVRHTMSSYLYELDAKGNLLNFYTLPPLPGTPYEWSWKDYLWDRLHAPAFWFGTLAYQKIGAALGNERLAKKADEAFHTKWNDTVTGTERIMTYSLIFAAVALAWARRGGMAWPRALAWAGFVLAFNLAGLITFWLVADWPVRVRCPECGRKRPVEEGTCPSCNAGWPTPARHGLEIFDEQRTVVATADAASA